MKYYRLAIHIVLFIQVYALPCAAFKFAVAKHKLKNAKNVTITSVSLCTERIRAQSICMSSLFKCESMCYNIKRKAKNRYNFVLDECLHPSHKFKEEGKNVKIETSGKNLWAIWYGVIQAISERCVCITLVVTKILLYLSCFIEKKVCIRSLFCKCSCHITITMTKKAVKQSTEERKKNAEIL